MNKFGIVLGIAAVAALAGCKDPAYQGRHAPQSDAKSTGAEEYAPAPAETAPAETAPAQQGTPIVVEERRCTCPAGTVHELPCACGAADCRCVVRKEQAKPLPPPEPEYTVYIVQRGDYLAKISKKYNITIDSIKRLNGLKDDNIRIGQKLKLPGKVEVGEQKVPAGAFAKDPARAKQPYAPYAGATKEYVVKSGDTLGAIAYGNGINIRQLKELNGLESDSIRVGQKLKIPAEKVVRSAAPAKSAKAEPAKPVKSAKAETAKPAEPAPAAPADEKADDVVVEPPAPVAPASGAADTAADSGTTYVVQEGDELIDIVVRFAVTGAALRELNNLGEDDKLVPGQVLKIPTAE